MPDEAVEGESENIEDLPQGDQEALARFFSRYRDRLLKLIDYRLDHRLRGRVSASDVLQEAYIDALKRMPHLEGEAGIPVFVWLRKVTIQRLIQVYREHILAQGRDASKEVRSFDDAGFEPSSDGLAELFGRLSPSQIVRRGDTIAEVREAMDRLDPVDREVLALRHFEDLSNIEVAAVIGITPAAASKRYLRALERLATRLHPPGEVPS